MEVVDCLTKKMGRNNSREKTWRAKRIDYFSIMLEIIPKLLISLLQDGMALTSGKPESVKRAFFLIESVHFFNVYLFLK
jgi:hypothetical protein